MSAKVGRTEFRLRGLEMTRLETFTDAAFAFAITMLVLRQNIPATVPELLDALKGIPAFLGSLANLMLFWSVHRRFSRRYGLEDTKTIFLTISLIAVMLIYVYPLKFMFSVAFAFMIPALRTQEFSRNQLVDTSLGDMFLVYGVGFVAFQFIFWLLFRHANGLRTQMELNESEVYDTRTDMGMALLQMVVGLTSVVLATALRNEGVWVVLAGWAYSLLSILMPWYAIRREKKRPVL
ncbi:MAG TPA: TMEM175 family protein [Fimbriimonadaceae bacterium]|nr:TMEM175 family protein [Fimbriimonadaceae bacterium]